MEAGGDYVSNSDGLQDCDAHGTLVAGIIAAAPSPDDSFAGVAPDATILSIRQNSGAFDLAGAGANTNDDPNATSTGYGNTQTLALAIARAVDLGATVINLSEVACAPVAAGLDDAAVGRAVRYAFERNVVVVAAAGNFNTQSMCNAQNVMTDPNQPLARGWDTVGTIASPAWFDDYVLTRRCGDDVVGASRIQFARAMGRGRRTGRAGHLTGPQRPRADQRASSARRA